MPGSSPLADNQPPRLTGFLLALVGQPDVGPAGEQVLQVPCRLAVAKEDEAIGHTQYRTIAAKLSGSRDAPPTRAPSTSDLAMKSLMFAAFTDPP